MPVTKFVRIALEGATSDGRTIERADIEAMGRNYDANKYGARIWLEHIRGMSPDSQFKAYGDVLETKSEEVTIDGVKKLALFAKLDVTEELVGINKLRQKIYSSMEIQSNFAKTGEPYLVGLAVTDSPASLGTEALKLFSSRKQSADNLFTVAEETTIEIEAEPQSENIGSILFNKVKDLLGKKSTADTENFTGISQAVEALATSQKTLLDQYSAGVKAFNQLLEDVKNLTADAAASKQAFSDLKTSLENEQDAGNQRQRATGGDGKIATDC